MPPVLFVELTMKIFVHVSHPPLGFDPARELVAVLVQSCGDLFGTAESAESRQNVLQYLGVEPTATCAFSRVAVGEMVGFSRLFERRHTFWAQEVPVYFYKLCSALTV